MSGYTIVSSDTTYQPNRWRWLIIAIGALILSGCQTMERNGDGVGFIVGDAPQSLNEEALIYDEEEMLGISGNDFYRVSDRPAPVADARSSMRTTEDGYTYVGDGELLDESLLKRDDSYAVSVPYTNASCLPNAVQPWGQPRDEYVCDGSDSLGRVVVRKDYSIKAGLDPSDTVAHYDTISGRTEIEASTRACIYAPRFAAARKIVRVQVSDSIAKVAPITARETLLNHTDRMEAGQVKLPEAIQHQIDTRISHNLHQNDPARLRENIVGLEIARKQLLPFENLQLVKSGVFEQKETALLEESVENANAWSSVQEVQVAVQGQPASVSQANFGGQEVLLYEVRPGDPHLRLIKLASRCTAASGESVHFTIRFDNTGDEAIGNVTIIDNLPARLEYVEKSADCSVQHELLAEFNEVGSHTLRFEITEPLEPSEGGIIRFECNVH